MVHFPGFARTRLWIHRAVRGFYPRGFPHSEIPGSMPACGSPRLIAACHVLHRLLLPRHPPCALSSLTIKFARCMTACAAICREILMVLASCSSHARLFSFVYTLGSFVGSQKAITTKGTKVHEGILAAYTSRIEALIKFTYSLVDCPIYSVVKHRPRLRWGQAPDSTAARLCGYEHCCSMFGASD
jgi:hypothetical protein